MWYGGTYWSYTGDRSAPPPTSSIASSKGKRFGKPSIERGAAEVLLKEKPEALPVPDQLEAESLAWSVGQGRKAKRVRYAYYRFKGMEPLDSLVAAGYRIAGVNAPREGGTGIQSLDDALIRAARWDVEKWVRDLHAQWRLSLADELEILSHEAVPVIRAAMSAKYASGLPDHNTRLNSTRVLLDTYYRQAKLALEAKRLEDEIERRVVAQRGEEKVDDETTRLLAEAVELAKKGGQP